MTNLDALGLDQYMLPKSMSSQFVSNITADNNFEAVGAANFGQGAIRTPIDVGVASGGAYIRFDASNNRIVINDGTTNRIIIGSL